MYMQIIIIISLLLVLEKNLADRRYSRFREQLDTVLAITWYDHLKKPNKSVGHMFGSLLQETRAAFDADSQSTGRPRLELTAAVAAGSGNINDSYNVPEMSR